MLKSINWSEDRDYKTGSENEPLQFYLDGLSSSTEFHLLLGYFSSAAINLLSVGFATFISKGGKMRMVINHLLSEKDKDAILNSQIQNGNNRIFDLTDIVSLGKVLDEYDYQFFECLAYMISKKRIEIKVIKPKEGKGISHYKSGVFLDGKNSVGYTGSCNFTMYGLSENMEELQIFLDWEDENSNRFNKKRIKILDNYFNETDKDVEYLPATEIEIAIKDKFGNKDIEELVVQEKYLQKKKMDLTKNQKLKETIAKLYENFKYGSEKPKFPYIQGARKYQTIAFENWKNNTQQGLFAMATGTGKTITSLNCLLEIYKKTGYYKALILVPTISLVNQWERECRKFNFNTIIKVYSKSRNWKNDISGILLKERLATDEKLSYIFISTYASFSKSNVFSELNQLSKKTLLISDECHNMGSSSLIKLLSKTTFKRRIGLSATPERQYDDEGNKEVFKYFNCSDKFTFEFPMKIAINGDKEQEIEPVLCRYFYYPHLVTLTELELNDYLKLSVKIAKYFNPQKGNFDKNDTILTALLLARKRIIHKAFNKLFAFRTIINEQFQKKGNLKYTLVYVPEGNDSNDFFETDYYTENDENRSDEEVTKIIYDNLDNDSINDVHISENIHLIDLYTKAIRDVDKRTTVRKFISGTSEREEMLELFTKGEIEVLTSMKCLDEGIDVPRAELAIFCSSTGNPRQFIQRRGRILRQHTDKRYAYIHDLVVIPKVSPESESYDMERNLLKKELERVNNFASLAENSSHTVDVLLDTMNHYNLNLYHNE